MRVLRGTIKMGGLLCDEGNSKLARKVDLYQTLRVLCSSTSIRDNQPLALIAKDFAAPFEAAPTVFLAKIFVASVASAAAENVTRIQSSRIENAHAALSSQNA